MSSLITFCCTRRPIGSSQSVRLPFASASYSVFLPASVLAGVNKFSTKCLQKEKWCQYFQFYFRKMMFVLSNSIPLLCFVLLYFAPNFGIMLGERQSQNICCANNLIFLVARVVQCIGVGLGATTAAVFLTEVYIFSTNFHTLWKLPLFSRKFPQNLVSFPHCSRNGSIQICVTIKDASSFIERQFCRQCEITMLLFALVEKL